MSDPEAVHDVDAVIVGAGFAGMYQLYSLRGLGLTAKVFEAGDGVGGTWYWNRYPGARCDSPSMDYSFSFSPELEQEWEWTERYPRQPEILRYLNHVADRFDLRKDIQFETRVTSAVYDEDTNRWTVGTDQGDTVTARYVITAMGCLSNARVPDFEGLSSFAGTWYHTGAWPHEGVDFTGKRVGVIGTGSTGIQAIPQIAKQAAHVTVFQRTANYSVPARNHDLDAEFQRNLKEHYRDYRAKARLSPGGIPVEVTEKSALDDPEDVRLAEYEARWKEGGAVGVLTVYGDLMINEESNATIAEFVRGKIRETVKDPETAELLCPYDHPLGTKRICVDTEYYETYNRDNVSLVSIKESPIERMTPKGLVTGGKEYEFDAIVLATGFDAMTGALFAVDIRGRDGLSLKEKWSAGPRTYLGLQTVGFPNLFTITGPGSPSVLSNMPVSIEQHVEWITDAIVYMREHGYGVMEPTQEAEDAWVQHVNEVGDSTLYPKANSWYVGANVPGKPRVFMPYVGGVGPYRELCTEVASKDYEGFAFAAAEEHDSHAVRSFSADDVHPPDHAAEVTFG